MPVEAILIAAALLVAALPIVASARDWTGRRTALTGASLVLATVAALWPSRAELLDPPTPEDFEQHRPVEVAADGYVSSSTCRACHPGEHASWADSYHSKMTQLASPAAVIGRFDGETVDFNDHRYTMSRRGDSFWVEVLGPGETTPTEHEIVMTTGSHNKQVYWYETGETRSLGQLPLYWLPEAERWIPRRAGFLSAPNREEVTENGRWNHTCIRCHSTHGRGKLDIETGAIDTQVSEFGIACESCHGPGAEHIAQFQNPLNRYAQHLGDTPTDSMVNPARLLAERSSQVCGQCHSYYEFPSSDDALRWSEEGFLFRPGDDLQASVILVRNDPNPEHPRVQEFMQKYEFFLQNRFWSDGVVRTTGREYNSLLESPCHTGGELSCLSCHQLHAEPGDLRATEEWADDQLRVGMDGDAACLQCHREYAETPTAHTRHAADSDGSRCMNCHMPHTSYGLLRAIRSHVVESPNARVSLATGRPNGCNLCHLDKTLAWTGEQLEAWYEQPATDFDEDDETVSAALLWLLRGDAHQRALIAWSMGWEPAREASGADWMAPFLGRLLDDPYDAVRYIAQRSLRTLPEGEELDYDFLGGPLAGLRARRETLERWRASEHDANAELLLGPEGELLEDALKHYLAQRDDRPVHLSE